MRTTPEQAGVLVVDDERHSVEAIRRTLEDDFVVWTAASADEAQDVLQTHADDGDVQVILCDQRMPGTTGLEFLRAVRERWPDIVRIIISGHTDAEDIIAGVNEAGIYQYVLKPWMPDQLLELVRDAVEARRLQNDVRRIDLEVRDGPAVLRRRLHERQDAAQARYGFRAIARGEDSPLEAVFDVAERIARHDLSVLLLGESGTGKELLARAIHQASPRALRPFVSENCAALPDSLLESELFGHKRGAFTGALQDHVGLFQRANGGTLFLDEIGDTTPSLQVKMLRVLQEGEVRPVGATRAVAVDVRVIAATHRDLEAEVRAGRFREDLYYRLATVTLSLPPLRERPGDLQAIVAMLLDEAATELAKPHDGFSEEAMACLLSYPWPGNIRELRNEVFRALALSDTLRVEADALSPKVRLGRAPVTAAAAGLPRITGGGPLQQRLDAIEAAILRETLLRHRWNKSRAAAELQLSRVGLRQKLQRLGLEAKK
ncbi:sigma-54-dependent transcriptional regulator [Solimonas variicoloris]|uniref:sigma-54-dependent transcriptional regulator n=1 Tax=Solimonas variicoloris TaxID=254408 RepID=UPI0003679ACE|nr:sigma-54 dependent transcriptional regulator [Solimonas variicoloris]